MFTFSAEHSGLPRRGPLKLNPLPDIHEPQPLDCLPPLPFYIEASEPLPLQPQSPIHKQRDQLEQQVEKYLQQRNRIDEEYNKLYGEHLQVKRELEDLRARYREGEQLFLQMEAENLRMYHELEQIRSRKEEKSRISVGIKRKDIPVVKISVPNPKSLAQESQKQSTYRQLKSASDELAHMRKLLQSEKQKTEHSQALMSKTIEQLSSEREILRSEIASVRDENKFLKEEIAKAKTIGNQGFNSMRGTQDYEKIKSELERIEKVHRSCDALLASKETQIFTLKCQLQKAGRQNSENSPEFHRTLSNTKLKANSSFIFERQSNAKEHVEAHTLFPDSSEKKDADLNRGSLDYNSILEQHMEVSARERKSLEQFTKELIKDLIAKIESLKNELDWANKKADHQKFQLERVYELLRDKKIQLDNCYNDLRNVSRVQKTPSKEERDDEFMKSIMKGRRNLSA